MTERFATLDVDGWRLGDAESSGGDEKSWLEGPHGAMWLFKPRTDHAGWFQGEDWAEKIASELAVRLGVPAAHVELAVRGGRRGSISRSLRPAGWELQHGALLLAEHQPDYEPRNRARRGHTLDNIEAALRDFQSPPLLSQCTAFEAFAGFLVLDALVANQDRHAENWAVLRPLPGAGEQTLAGSYDHGSSLGFNLTDDRRTSILGRDGVVAFAARAKAQRFDSTSDGRLSLVELAHRALARCTPAVRAHWLACVAATDEVAVSSIVERTPGLSDPVHSFTTALLTINRKRPLDGH